MITKIKSSEYLKRYDNMDGAEKQLFNDRVGQWLRSGARLLVRRADEPDARLLNVMQVSQYWNDAEQAAWTNGVCLLTAFSGIADTWLPDMLYVKAANRCIHKMVNTVSSFKMQDSGSKLHVSNDNSDAKKKSAKVEAVSNAKQERSGKPDTCESMNRETKNLQPCVTRPRHIDQYVHLLPEKTQERAAQYGPLKREIEAARQNLQLLMDDPKSTSVEREKWAKLAARNDEKIARINAELDREWEHIVASGRVTVDDLGNARIVKDQDIQSKQNNPNDAKRIEYLKRWLRDTRRNHGDERRKQWEENCKELLALGGEITDSIRKAGEYYGAALPNNKTEKK